MMKERVSVDLYYPVSTLYLEKFPAHWLVQCGSVWRRKGLLAFRNPKQACHLLLALLVSPPYFLVLKNFSRSLFLRQSIMLNEKHDKEDRK
jgi:hypothetical protein